MKKFLYVLCFLILASLACNQQLSTGGPTPEYPPIVASTQSAQSLASKLSSLNAASGDVTLTITEAEMTSYLAQQIAQQQNSSLENPQMYFRDDKMKLYAKLVTTNLTANALIIINPTVNNGQIALVVEKADVGPLPVSEDLLKNLTSTINDQLLGTLSKLPKGVKIKTITAKDGTLTLTANISK